HPVQKPKERTLIGPADAPSNRATSSRNGGRNHLGTPSEIKSECWATSSRIRGRLPPESAQLGAQHPGGAVGAEAELVLQLQRRDAVGVRRHQERRPEPDRQRQLAGMHDRAGSHRGLTTAVGAFVSESFGLQQPSSAAAVTRADKPFRPTTLEKVLRTRAFRRKTPLEFDQRPWNPSLRPRHDTLPCSFDTNEQLTPMFAFCTLNLDRPDPHA